MLALELDRLDELELDASDIESPGTGTTVEDRLTGLTSALDNAQPLSPTLTAMTPATLSGPTSSVDTPVEPNSGLGV